MLLGLLIGLILSLFSFTPGFPQSVGDWLRSAMGRAHVALSNETVADVLGRLTSNEELRGLFAYHWGNYGLPPSEASWAIHAMVS